MEPRRRSFPRSLPAVCKAALGLQRTIEVLAGAGADAAPYVVVAKRECARVQEIASRAVDRGEVDDWSFRRACAHLDCLEGLVAACVLGAAERCEQIADGLAKREEWAAPDLVDEDGVRSAVASKLARRLQHWAAEDAR
jgi:hypothetical protein